MVRGKLASRIKHPNAEGDPKRPDFVRYAFPKTLLVPIEETENRPKSELAAALAHHFNDEVSDA